jgi:phosphoribosylglycinamide formyltransferase 2
LNEFELHLRAILGLPIPSIENFAPSASAVILASEKSDSISYTGVAEALAEKDVDIKLFGKPSAHKYRRMGVALAKGNNVQEAREKAKIAADKINII